ncbi:MAG: NADH:ubiquinone oxidoreductase, subunit RnfA [Pygmaiobacter massiliensis]|nr:NADH:ubiquinone oxidoreductase, subunit RnfA [Pygmaiobacter massiliensis]
MTILNDILTFFLYAVIAIAAQNAVFTRALGVSRLTRLVETGELAISKFTVLLAAVQLLSAPLAFYANRLLDINVQLRAALRPLVMVLCSGVAFFVVLLALGILSAKTQMKSLREYARALPLATFNCCVIGTLLLTTTGGYTLVQSMGFELGSAVGYAAALVLVSEGQRKIQNRNVPASFRGLPVTLVYIGVLALAIYGLTGHTLAI